MGCNAASSVGVFKVGLQPAATREREGEGFEHEALLECRGVVGQESGTAKQTVHVYRRNMEMVSAEVAVGASMR